MRIIAAMAVVDDEVLFRAQKGDRGALEAVLETAYPAVHRMAYGLSGREDVGHGIVRFVMMQAVRQAPQWRDGEAATRWFHHHTVLTARRAAKHQPTARDDLLLKKADGADLSYTAFIKGLRALTMQQREAFILHHGEKFTLRELGIAMDCSTKAAEMHLRTAQAALEPMAGPAFATLKEKLAATYAGLAPVEDVVRPSVKSYVARTLWPRRIKRLFKALVALAIIAAIAWAAMRYRHLIPWERIMPAK